MKLIGAFILLATVAVSAIGSLGAGESARGLASSICPDGISDGSDPDECLNAIGSTLKKEDVYAPGSRAASTNDFGSGFLTASFSTSSDIGRGALVRTDGSFIVFGKALSDTTYWDVAIIKYLPDGSIDTSFNTTGKVVTTFAQLDDTPHSIAAHSNGTFVIGGRASNGTDLDLALYRYTSNGQLDTSFGTVGALRTSIGTGTDIVREIAVYTDGKILVAGYTWQGTEYQGVVARYETDGSLDTSFNTLGSLILSFTTGSTQFASLDVDTAGRILVGGGLFISDWDAVGIRLISNGTLDTSFNTTGWAIRSFSTANDFAFAVRRFNGGDRWVGSGIMANVLGDTDAVVFRLTSDGLLDTSFATRGFAQRSIGTTDQRVLSMVVGTLGKTQVFGHTSANGTASGNNLLTLRYTSNGALDTQWNGSGQMLATFSTAEDQFLGVGNLGDNAFFAVGWTQGADADFAITRIGGRGFVAYAGLPDYSFGTSGSATISGLAPAFAVASGLLLETSGKYLVLGFTSAANEQLVVNRYNINGTLDTSWNTTGTFKGATTRACSPGRDMPMNDGKYYFSCHNGRVARINSDGTFDTSYNTLGVTVAFASTAWGNGGIGFDSSGRAYFSAVRLSVPIMVLQRFNTNGTLDTLFKTTGISNVTVQMSTSFTYHPIPLAVNNSGKPAVAVVRYDSSDQTYLSGIARFETDGTWDTSFGTTGYVPVVGPGNSHGNITSVFTVDSTGEGYFYADATYGDPFYAGFAGERGYGFGRLTSNGTSDTSFGIGGRYDYGLGTAILTPAQLQPLPNGGSLAIMMGSFSGANLASGTIYVARLRSDYSLDTGFGFGGISKGYSALSTVGTNYTNYRQVIRTADGYILATCNDSVCRYFQ